MKTNAEPFPFAIVPANDDEKFMLEALKEAWKAFQKDEVPVGAVLVQNGRVIARGYNQVELLSGKSMPTSQLVVCRPGSGIPPACSWKHVKQAATAR